MKAVDGVQSVQRVVCGGCLDFKVVTALSADKYGAWEAADHAPEAAFLEAAKAIPGVTAVSTEHSAPTSNAPLHHLEVPFVNKTLKA